MEDDPDAEFKDQFKNNLDEKTMKKKRKKAK
jgi:hypothetical protein